MDSGQFSLASMKSSGGSRNWESDVPCYSPSVPRQAQIRTYRRRPGDPLKRQLKVYTLDSTTARTDGAVATIEIPWEPLGPGPEGVLFYIDPTGGSVVNSGVDLDDPRLLIRGGLEPSVSDHGFHQQMVYAVCSKIYAQFQVALGRLIPWGFDASGQNGRLKLRPHVSECGANASYEKDRGQ